MSDLEDLSEDEKSVLLACCDANNFSLGSHVPKEAIMRKLQKLNPKYKKKAFKKLRSKGLIRDFLSSRFRDSFNLLRL